MESADTSHNPAPDSLGADHAPMRWYAAGNQTRPTTATYALGRGVDDAASAVLAVICDAEFDPPEINGEVAAYAARLVNSYYNRADGARDPILPLRAAVLSALDAAHHYASDLMVRVQRAENPSSLPDTFTAPDTERISILAVIVRGERLTAAHIGACRLLALRDDRIYELVDDSATTVEISERKFGPSDRALLCTRALTDLIGMEQIASMLRTGGSDRAIVDTLVDESALPASHGGVQRIVGACMLTHGHASQNPRSRQAEFVPRELSKSARQPMPRRPVSPDAPRRYTGATTPDFGLTPAASPGGLVVLRPRPVRMPPAARNSGLKSALLRMPDSVVSIAAIMSLIMITLFAVLIMFNTARPAVPESSVAATVTMLPIAALPDASVEPTEVIAMPATATPDALAVAAAIAVVPPTALPLGGPETPTAAPTADTVPTTRVAPSVTASPEPTTLPTAEELPASATHMAPTARPTARPRPRPRPLATRVPPKPAPSATATPVPPAEPTSAPPKAQPPPPQPTNPPAPPPEVPPVIPAALP